MEKKNDIEKILHEVHGHLSSIMETLYPSGYSVQQDNVVSMSPGPQQSCLRTIDSRSSIVPLLSWSQSNRKCMGVMYGCHEEEWRGSGGQEKSQVSRFKIHVHSCDKQILSTKWLIKVCICLSNYSYISLHFRVIFNSITTLLKTFVNQIPVKMTYMYPVHMHYLAIFSWIMIKSLKNFETTSILFHQNNLNTFSPNFYKYLVFIPFSYHILLYFLCWTQIKMKIFLSLVVLTLLSVSLAAEDAQQNPSASAVPGKNPNPFSTEIFKNLQGIHSDMNRQNYDKLIDNFSKGKHGENLSNMFKLGSDIVGKGLFGTANQKQANNVGNVQGQPNVQETGKKAWIIS